MNNILKIIIGVLVSIFTSYAYEINDKVIYQKSFENSTIYLPLNNYRTLVFEDRIKNIQLTNSANIRAEFIDSLESPLKMLKILGKEIGNESAIVTLESGKTIQVNFSIMQNLDNIISIVKATYPKLIIEQANDTIILKGYVKDYREKDLVIDIFKKAGISIDEKLVDMIETSAPSKMIRVKLYAVEIKKDEGLKLKNNWVASSKNYMTVTDGDEYYNEPLGSFPSSSIITGYRYETQADGTIRVLPDSYKTISSSDRSNVNNQRNKLVEDALDDIMKNAVSLTGGLTGTANYLGKYFNVGLTLQYLADNGVANILDETTLITLENKEANFHAGGTIRIKTQTTTAEGIPSTDIEKIRYGLQLRVKAKNVMQDNYIDLEITTSNTKIDWSRTVDDIPSFLENEVITNVMAKNGSTIVLGGLVNSSNSFDEDKIPLLGDVPVLGFLFRSKSFREGKSELVFFLTPEVVNPAENNQEKNYEETKKLMLDTSRYRDEDNLLERSLRKKEKEPIKKIEQKQIKSEKNIEIKKETKKLSSQEEHEKRVNKILGYE